MSNQLVVNYAVYKMALQAELKIRIRVTLMLGKFYTEFLREYIRFLRLTSYDRCASCKNDTLLIHYQVLLS